MALQALLRSYSWTVIICRLSIPKTQILVYELVLDHPFQISQVFNLSILFYSLHFLIFLLM